jgi:hypothetical protein
MKIQLPAVIEKYLEASNRHDVKSILSCFADDAVVRDEKQEFRGKKAIENWVVTTIEKYKFRVRPLTVSNRATEPVVVFEVSGTFPGSPVALDYHFTIADDQILSLTID